MMRLFCVVGCLTLVSGTVLADDARQLRTEAAVLVHAAEAAATARERRALLEEAHGKLLDIMERYPYESARLNLYLGGKRVRLLSDDVAAMIATARLLDLNVGNLRDVLGRTLSPTAADENGWTDLHYAAALNRPELAEALLDAGANYAARLKDDEKPLSAGLRQALNALGLEMNFTRQSYEPLHIAAFGNAKLIVTMLVAAGADIHAKGKGGWMPLHAAAFGNAQEVASALIAAGADLHAKDKYGLTPLHIAAENNAPEVASALIEAGADIHARDNQNRTPLTIVVESDTHEAAAVLKMRQKGIEDHLANLDVGNLRDVLGRPLSPTASDENGWTDLHYAAALNRPELAEALLDAGANYAARLKDDEKPLSAGLRQALNALGLEMNFTRQSYEPLHIAAFGNAKLIVTMLVAAGADIHAKGKSGWMPLHAAAFGNAQEVASALIAAGADIHAKTKKGWTPLRIAANYDAAKAATALIAAGADLHAKDKYGLTPLHFAASKNAAKAVAALIAAGADIHTKTKDEWGWTPLHFAASKNAAKAAAALIAAGADLHAKDKYGWTPLHFAASKNAAKAAAALIAAGADIHAKTKKGWTPLRIAAKHDAKGVAALLIEQGAN